MTAKLQLKDRYDVESLPQAHSGMGEVWFARDVLLQRRVVVKLVNRALLDADTVRRFKREVLLTARLRHPGVPVVFDMDVHEGQPYMVMERIDGIALSDLVAEHGRLPVGWVAAIGAQVCSVLLAALEIGLVHRDIKPSNLMLDSSGAVTVLDFGLAAALGDSRYSKITETGQSLGTLGYMAPEQIRGEASTHRTDLYGLGATLYELLTGQPSAEGSTTDAIVAHQLKGLPPRPSIVRPGLPEALDDLIQSMLSPNADDRPADASAVYEALVGLIESLPALQGIVSDRLDAQRAYSAIVGRTTTVAAPVVSTVASRSQQLTDARSRAAQLLDSGHADEAIESLVRVLDDTSGRRTTDAGLLEILELYATALHRNGQLRAAARQWRRLERRYTERDGAEAVEAFECRRRAALVHIDLHEPDRAVQQLTGLLRERIAIDGPDHDRVRDLREQIGRIKTNR